MLLKGILLTSDKQKIAYYHYKNNHDKLVIIAHGFYNSKDCILLQSLAQSFLDTYDVFMFDFRGHGKSSGLFSWTSKENQDLNTVLDYLKGKYEKKGIIAFSLGGSIAINVLSEGKAVDSFVCVSAPSDFDKIDYKFWELDWENDVVYTLFSKEGKIGKGVRPGPFWLKKIKPIDSVKRISIPVFYIHGDQDWVIRPWHSKVLYENTNSKKKIEMVKDGPHAEYLMKKFLKQLVTSIKKWFKETM